MPMTRAFVVHGEAGWDEATPAGPFVCYDVRPGRVERTMRDPRDAGIARCALDDLRGGDAAATRRACARRSRAATRPAHRDALVLGARARARGHRREPDARRAVHARAQGRSTSGAGARLLERIARVREGARAVTFLARMAEASRERVRAARARESEAALERRALARAAAPPLDARPLRRASPSSSCARRPPAASRAATSIAARSSQATRAAAQRPSRCSRSPRSSTASSTHLADAAELLAPRAGPRCARTS